MPAVLCAMGRLHVTSGGKFADCRYVVKQDRVGGCDGYAFAAEVNDNLSLPFHRRRLTKYPR
jgi:hypothetical protein